MGLLSFEKGLLDKAHLGWIVQRFKQVKIDKILDCEENNVVFSRTFF